MLAVQTFFTLAFMASLGTQVLLAALVVRWPLGLVLPNEWILTFMSCLGNATAGNFFLNYLINKETNKLNFGFSLQLL